MNLEVKTLSILKFDLNVKLNTYVIIHHHGQFMNPDSMSKIEGFLGSKTFLEMTYDFTEDIEEVGHCDKESNEGYDLCVGEAIARYVYGLEEHQCYVVFNVASWDPTNA